ncbi:alpha/beta hydrolase [Anabaena sp. UHCC 0399]|uniref:alpha/beta fold hydrolase n=1 Tax=Anabaena sp. UHCC 0399 TaxID=3110238 RepID=UPI002B21910E|nr:alpha/beta hydrolase [Anabaena sp. UHCC 0399]MEA5568503.1 alpha/beta hydrolase [Anabaena sp. UHCC 0399]
MKYLLGSFVLLFILVLAGAVYQAIATRADIDKYPPPGKLVDVGGYKLHINCVGEGSPTVVMEYGLGGLSLVWSLVESEVAKFARVCTYDRAGYGWSESSSKPRTSQEMVEELHTLLTNAGIKSPYILVGHSLGGLNVRLFASQYPDEVVGIVLVDAVPANVYARLAPVFQNNMAATRRMFRSLSLITRLGLLRLLVQLLGKQATPEFVRKLPSKIQPMIVAKFLPKTFETAIAESLLMEISTQQVSQSKLSDDLPLIVLSHGINMFSNIPDQQAKKAGLTWEKLQAEIAQLSSQGSLQIAQTSGHNIHIDQPKLVVDAIRQVASLQLKIKNSKFKIKDN